MNKYFLSLMSILILFQSFKVSDEIFNNKKDQKKGYIILEQDDDDDEVTIADDKSDVKEEKIDFESLFTKASLDGGEKIAKQCVACHSVDNSLKVKVGPPLWGIVNRNAASISDLNTQKPLLILKKHGPEKNFFTFWKNPKII